MREHLAKLQKISIKVWAQSIRGLPTTFYPASAGQTREESSVRFKHNQTERVGRFTGEDMPEPAQLGAQNLNAKAGGFASAAGGGI